MQLAFDLLPLVLGLPENLLPGDPVVGQLGLERLDHRLSLCKVTLGSLARLGRFPESLPFAPKSIL
jgi:hypothetical protein